jgi:hypothetical protein
MLNGRIPLTMVIGRARNALARLEARLRQGKINSRHTFLAELTEQIGDFVVGALTPSMEVPYMQRDDLLIRELVEEPLEQAATDVSLAGEQIAAIRELTLQVFNLCQSEREGLKLRLGEVTALTDSFRLWASDSDTNFIWAGDTFNDLSKVDPNSDVWVDPSAGVVTLTATSASSLSPYIVRATLDRSLSEGGLPGNNLEIAAPGVEAFTSKTGRKEPRPTLFGEVGLPSNRLANLWDGAPNSWFEWERYYTPVPQRVVRAGLAYVFDPSGKKDNRPAKFHNWNCYLKWPGDDRVDTGKDRKGFPLTTFLYENARKKQGKKTNLPEEDSDGLIHEIAPLQLSINIELDEPRKVSWIQLTPLFKGKSYPTVDHILVSNDGQAWRDLLREKGPTTLIPQMNRGIDFTSYGLSASNFEGVGVWVGPSVPIRYLRILLRQTSAYECPLGIAHLFYRKGGERVKGPVQVVGSFESLPGQEAELQLDDTTTTTRRLRESYDILQGYRQVIALRDLVLQERLYRQDGHLLSRPFRLARSIRAVSLLVTEEIPEDWPEGRWIDYEVSSDGSTWHAIIPQQGQLEDSVVHFDQPTSTLYFRARLNRPEDRENESPQLLAYGLKGLPA